VRLPGGDTVVVDDNEPLSSSGRGGIVGDQEGEVVEAEFKDLK
jgi:hypothetical protein